MFGGDAASSSGSRSPLSAGYAARGAVSAKTQFCEALLCNPALLLWEIGRLPNFRFGARGNEVSISLEVWRCKFMRAPVFVLTLWGSLDQFVVRTINQCAAGESAGPKGIPNVH